MKLTKKQLLRLIKEEFSSEIERLSEESAGDTEEYDRAAEQRRLRRARERSADKEFFGDESGLVTQDTVDVLDLDPEATHPNLNKDPASSQQRQRDANEVLDSAREEILLQRGSKGDKFGNIAYRALFVEKDPVAWEAYAQFKKKGLNIFGNERVFVNFYWEHPTAYAKAKDEFEKNIAHRAQQDQIEVPPPLAQTDPASRDWLRQILQTVGAERARGEAPTKVVPRVDRKNKFKK